MRAALFGRAQPPRALSRGNQNTVRRTVLIAVFASGLESLAPTIRRSQTTLLLDSFGFGCALHTRGDGKARGAHHGLPFESSLRALMLGDGYDVDVDAMLDVGECSDSQVANDWVSTIRGRGQTSTHGGERRRVGREQVCGCELHAEDINAAPARFATLDGTRESWS